MYRYLLFAGGVYCPYGGMDDYCGSFDTVKDALEHLANKEFNSDELQDPVAHCIWWHIYDSTMHRIVMCHT